MTTELAQEIAEIGVRLVDDAYLAWRAAASHCELAMRVWTHASCRNRSTGYAAYQAALDREEAAANDLQRLSHLTHACRQTMVQV